MQIVGKKFLAQVALVALVVASCRGGACTRDGTTPGSSKLIRLKLWEHEREDVQKLMDQQGKRFSQQFPNIAISRSHYKTEDLRVQFQTAALGGGGPDMMVAPNDFAGPLSLMQIAKPVPPEFAPFSDVYPELVEGVRSIDGRIWGVPVSRGNHLMLFVNRELVPQAPQTIAELVESAKKVRDQSGGKIYGFAYNLNEPFWFVTFLASFGGEMIRGGEPKLGSEAMIRALDLVKKLKFEDKIVPNDCDYACADTLFSDSKCAMTINGDWALPKYSEILKSKLIVAPLPMNEQTQIPMKPLVSGKYLFINGSISPERMQAVLEYATFVLSPAEQEIMAVQGGRLPSTKSGTATSGVASHKDLNLSQLALQNGQPMPMDVEFRAIWDAIRPQLQQIMAGRIASDAAAKLMQQDAEQKIKDMRR